MKILVKRNQSEALWKKTAQMRGENVPSLPKVTKAERSKRNGLQP
jgi:hypothetical protein